MTSTSATSAVTAPEVPEGGAPLGPGSLTWEYFADTRMALLGPRAAVLQNMLPALGQGVDDHSVWFAETLARLQRSIPPIFRTVYGADPATSGHEVRDFHRSIKGRLPDGMTDGDGHAIGGRPYSALNPETYYWAHATFVEHLVVATDTFIRRLTPTEKDQLVAESLTWYARYGVSEPPDAPRTWADFERYWQQALDHRIVKHRTAAYGVGYVTKGWPRPANVPEPVWRIVHRPVDAASAFVTAGGLPPQARELLSIPWSERQERRYQRFATVVRAADPLVRRLPRRARLHPIAAGAFAREGR